MQEDSYICWYDLTSDSSNLALLIPQTRKGPVSVGVTFSGPLFEEITMLVYSERNVTIGIDKRHSILVNYVL